jgi:two-component system cell cycle response regulator DivK
LAVTTKLATIIVADDRASSRELIRTMIESIGHEVLEAENGAQVLDLLRRKAADLNAPRLVLLDLQMPVMDGFTAVREMQANPQFADIPVIALTASAMTGDRERALNGGFTGYITKPVRLKDLRGEIERILAR